MNNDALAHAHFEYPEKARCNGCANCLSVKRWKDVYWAAYLNNGGDEKWAKSQMRQEDKALPCQRGTI